MCIGIPMRVLAIESGHAICEGRGERRRVNTALVNPVNVDDWLLVFLDDARERLDAHRANEVNAALDLVFDAVRGLDASGEAGFPLPSAMTPEQLRSFLGSH